ncbi:MAG: hypothetical protein AB7T32_06925 [Dehalococcoidia bacterium]
MLAVSAFIVSTAIASAHERRAVGEYSFVVGWLTEPAFVDQPNSLDLRISKTADASPVTGLNTSLKFEVTADGKTKEVPIAARFNTPGAYNAYVFPTKTGVYTFRIYGTIEGKQIDEKFTSGPGTFGSIEEPNYFPTALGAAADEEMGGFEQRIAALESDSDSGSSNSGTLFGIIGIVVGAVGLAVGGLALSRSGKSA